MGKAIWWVMFSGVVAHLTRSSARVELGMARCRNDVTDRCHPFHLFDHRTRQPPTAAVNATTTACKPTTYGRHCRVSLNNAAERINHSRRGHGAHQEPKQSMTWIRASVEKHKNSNTTGRAEQTQVSESGRPVNVAPMYPSDLTWEPERFDVFVEEAAGRTYPCDG